jgi:hypothetical protein
MKSACKRARARASARSAFAWRHSTRCAYRLSRRLWEYRPRLLDSRTAYRADGVRGLADRTDGAARVAQRQPFRAVSAWRRSTLAGGIRFPQSQPLHSLQRAAQEILLDGAPADERARGRLLPAGGGLGLRPVRL